MSAIQLRDVLERDLRAVHALNRASVPHVNDVSLDTIVWFAEHAPYFRVASTDDEEVAGFLIGLTPDVPYDSPNFLKFRRWFADFVYVDRLAVDRRMRRCGVARLLYQDLERYARPIASRITCEVNIRPWNGDSLAFHRRMGFAQVGTQKTELGSKTVALLARPLSAGTG